MVINSFSTSTAAFKSETQKPILLDYYVYNSSSNQHSHAVESVTVLDYLEKLNIVHLFQPLYHCLPGDILTLFLFLRYNQVNAIRLACRTGMEECITLVTAWFNDWMTTGNNM